MLLRWAQQAFADFRTVPPGTGIVHREPGVPVAIVVRAREVAGELVAFPDTLVGTDSHTFMINGLGVLGSAASRPRPCCWASRCRSPPRRPTSSC